MSGSVHNTSIGARAHEKTKAERWEEHQKSSHIHNRVGALNEATGERCNPPFWYRSINHMSVTVSHVHGAFKESKGVYHDFVKSLSAKSFQYMHLPFYSVSLFESLSNFCERNSQWPTAIEHAYKGQNKELETINDEMFKDFFWSLVLNMYQYIEPFDKYLSFYNQPKFVNGGEQNKNFTAYFNWATQILIDKIVATEYSKSDGDIRECVFDILKIVQNSSEMLGEYYFSAIEKLLKKISIWPFRMVKKFNLFG